MITIWGRANSTNVKKVVWSACECGVEWERVDVGGPFGGLDDPAFRTMNPLGLIPVIRDGDLVLAESNAIVRYLAARYSPTGLWNADPVVRARADARMDWATSALMGPFFTLLVGLVRTVPAERDLTAIVLAKRKAESLLVQLDEALQDEPFLSGARLGIGDVPAGCIVHALRVLGIGGELRNLSRWYDELLSRPAYRAHVAVELS